MSLSFKAPIELMQLLVISLFSAVDLVSFLEIFGKKVGDYAVNCKVLDRLVLLVLDFS